MQTRIIEEASVPEVTPQAIVAPRATPTPTPTLQQRIARIKDVFRQSFRQKGVYAWQETQSYADIVTQCDGWQLIDADIQRACEDAFWQACETLGEAPGVLHTRLPGWKLVASLYHRLGARAEELLKNNSIIHVEIGSDGVNMTADFTDIRSLIAGVEGEMSFGPKLTFAYLNTVYDENGEETAFTQYKLGDAYIRALRDPLPGGHIKNGWYADRDRGARKHTGTDIKMPEDTPILSCTDGVVVNIGSNAGAGNYVVVLDDAGLEYHYYHMVRLTGFLEVGERVSAGDIIGNVGNTGNSSANHLHLTMISPDFTYINPYPVLREMRKLQKTG
ncbi:MAG: M23 family metallopeptidase [Clostridiales bacterium]|nr:M23 family metallopeptidase [Clostridiales bacterium]